MLQLTTIITACRNNEATIAQTMHSVVDQWLPAGYKVEHIVVDGASTDDTVSIVRRYESDYVAKGWTLKVVSRPDDGPYFAMNTGLEMATGDVVGFLNADDFFTTDLSLAFILSPLHSPHCDAMYGEVRYVRSCDPYGKCMRYYSAGRFRPWQMRMGFMPPHPSFYCKKEIYDRYGGFNTSYRLAADFECLVRLLLVHKIRTYYIGIDFVTMRTGGLSSGLAAHKTILREDVRALRENGIWTTPLFMVLKWGWKAALIAFNRLFNTTI